MSCIMDWKRNDLSEENYEFSILQTNHEMKIEYGKTHCDILKCDIQLKIQKY